ncbi:hypothetical protein ACJX0J_004898 (mitochondrion) [Zea mays]
MDGMGRRESYPLKDKENDRDFRYDLYLMTLPLFLYLFYFSTSATGGDRLIRKAIKDAHLRKFNADHIDGKVHNCSLFGTTPIFFSEIGGMDENTGKMKAILIPIISGTFTLLYFTLLYSSNHTITISVFRDFRFIADFSSRDGLLTHKHKQNLPNYFLVGEEPISFHLTHSILFKEDSLSDSRDMQASWAGHLKEIKRVRVLVRVTTSGSTLHTSEHWTAEKVHLSGIYLLHNAHATNDKVEAHSDEEDGELINNPILLVGYEYALVVVIAAGLVLTVGQL